MIRFQLDTNRIPDSGISKEMRLEERDCMTIIYCPSCGSILSSGDPSNKIMSCPCGMTFKIMITETNYTAEERKEMIRESIDQSLDFYHRKNDEAYNAMKESKRCKAVDWIVDEIMKGPYQGGTMATIPEWVEDFGSSQLWISLQAAIMIRDPVCRICGQKVSKEVHHIRPRHLKGHDHPRNLIGLCLDCHDNVHRCIDDGIQDLLDRSMSIRPQKYQKSLDEVEST